MASHRKPRTPLLRFPAARRGTVTTATAALASAVLLPQAHAEPGSGRPSIDEVRKRVDTLYREAGSATQEYNAAKEEADRQRERVDALLDRAARHAEEVNDARRALGRHAAAQYRAGGVSQTAVLLLSSDPQGLFERRRLLERMAESQRRTLEEYREKRRAAEQRRAEASEALAELDGKRRRLAAEKKAVQEKLAEARKLLSKLTAEERARLAAQERARQEEARRRAAAAERERQEQQERERERGRTKAPEAGHSSRAGKVVAFAKAQLGKPYVWGANGPDSYDCSSLTQSAWRSAGISLPRTTYDQVDAGAKVAKSQLRPGDLVFFYDDVSHVGIYVGGGQMIHAPKPGTTVRYESIDYMPFHSAVRPG